MSVAVEMKHITKYFGTLCANNDISLTILKNSIHGVIGENGAGKSTLMKILYGMYSADKGEIYLNGEKVFFHSPKDAIAKRVGMIHQHFTLVPSMTVLDNVVLGRPPQKFAILDRNAAVREVQELCARCGFPMKLSVLVENLSVGLRQRVEILKALYLGADILIMDEPTAVLTPQEIEGLFVTLRQLSNQGTSVILITHKLSEVMAITDHITVLRNGKVTGNVLTKEINEVKLARMMVGREMLPFVKKNDYNPGKPLLRLEHVSCKNADEVMVINDVSFTVHSGEIVGIAGVQGNGQTELAEIIIGLDDIYSGDIFINEIKIEPAETPWQRRRNGLGLIPEDRQIMGSAGVASTEDNFLMTIYRMPEISRHGLLSRKKGIKVLNEHVEKFNIKMADAKNPGSSLSGGNMQKLIVAREHYLQPRVLLAAQPTRGVDIGATEFIHQKLVEMRDNRNGVLLISNELSEIMSLSDRILVIYNGRIIGEVDGKDADVTTIGLWMAGITNSNQESEDSDI